MSTRQFNSVSRYSTWYYEYQYLVLYSTIVREAGQGRVLVRKKQQHRMKLPGKVPGYAPGTSTRYCPYSKSSYPSGGRGIAGSVLTGLVPSCTVQACKYQVYVTHNCYTHALSYEEGSVATRY